MLLQEKVFVSSGQSILIPLQISIVNVVNWIPQSILAAELELFILWSLGFTIQLSMVVTLFLTNTSSFVSQPYTTHPQNGVGLHLVLSSNPLH